LIICATFANKEVGDKIEGSITDMNGKEHFMPALILATATKQEYIDYCQTNDAIPFSFTQDEWNRLNYYKVSVD
jgi:hypothetical protein